MTEAPSTTGYGILGLLALEPQSAYELARQLTRGWRHFWPRAERGFYTEPKKLVALGLAKARTERRGKRSRTVYTITPAGRRALREWLKEPSRVPSFESEGLVRLGFSENATPEDLLRAIDSFRTALDEISAMGVNVAGGYLDETGLYPQRIHLITLMGGFLVEYAQMLDRFSTWATNEVSKWESTSEPAEFANVRDELRRQQDVFERLMRKNARSART